MKLFGRGFLKMSSKIKQKFGEFLTQLFLDEGDLTPALMVYLMDNPDLLDRRYLTSPWASAITSMNEFSRIAIHRTSIVSETNKFLGKLNGKLRKNICEKLLLIADRLSQGEVSELRPELRIGPCHDEHIGKTADVLVTGGHRKDRFNPCLLYTSPSPRD